MGAPLGFGGLVTDKFARACSFSLPVEGRISAPFNDTV
jgi:hypothetical protein